MPEVSASGTIDGSQTAEGPQSTVGPVTPEFKRNFFINTPDTTGAVPPPPEKRGLLKRKEDVQEEKSEWVQFSGQTRTEMTTFLDNFVTNAHGAYKKDHEILKAQPHAEELMKLLGGTEQELDAAALKTRISEALDTPQGWVMAKTLLEQQTAMQMFALGLMTTAELQKKNINPQDLLASTAAGDRRRDKIKGWTGHFTKLESAAVGAGVGAVGGFFGTKMAETGVAGDAVRFLASNIPMDRGLAVGVLLGAGGAFLGSYLGGESEQDASKPGFASSKDSLKSIQNNKEYARYIKAVVGVDVNDFKFDEETGAIETVGNGTTNDIAQILNGAKSNLETRNHYFDSLGVPHEDRDIMPEQFILKGDKAGFEHTGERVNAAILERYENLGGGKDIAKNLELYRKARELVLADLTEDLVRKLGKSPSRSVTDIQTKITERTANDGRIIKEKREKATKDAPELKEMLDGSIRPRIRAIETYEEAQKSLNEARKALPKYITDTFGSGVTTVEEALQQIKEARRGTTPVEIIVEGRQVSIEKIEKRKRDAREEYQERAGEILRDHGIGDDEPRERYKERLKILDESSKEQLNADLAEIKKDSNVLDEIENKIKDYQDAIKNSERGLDPHGDISVARHADVYHRPEDREKAFKLVDNAEVQNLLLTGTRSEILKRINELHKSDPDFGWEEADNDDIEREELLVYALVTARAIKDDGDSIRGFREHAHLGTITSEGVTYEQLESLSVPELKSLLSETGLDEGQIAEAQTTVKEFATRMTKATRAMEKDLERRGRRAERLAEKVDLKDEINQLEVTKALMERQGAIFGLTADFIADVSKSIPIEADHAKKLSELSSVERGKYTASEKARGNETPVAYYEFLNVLFDYQDKPDREERFKKISKELSPTELYKILNELSERPVEGSNLNELLFSLQDNIKRGMVSRRAVRGMFEGVIDTFEARAMAMP